jgi:3-methyladenine DNA glycosylase/8-oxoguanine DNA glycosylase
MEWTLPARPPFSLPSVIGSHGWVRLAPFRRDETSGGLERIERLASGRVVELLVQEAPGGVRVAAACRGGVTPPLANGATPLVLDAAEQAEISGKVTWMLGLDQDFSGFYALARQEPKLAQVEEKAQGRLLRCSTLFEDVVKTILTTNTTWSGTIRMVDALVSLYGSPLPSDPARRAFPTPEDLVSTDAEALRTQARLGYRAPYVLALARSVASGDLDLEALRTGRTGGGRELPTPELRSQLLALQGVGPYAAACLLMILGRYDFVPVDSWALKLVSHEWHGGQPVGRAEVEAAFARWGTWQGLAFWFWDWSYPA